MNGKSKSIILQVAFKEAAQGNTDIAAVETLTLQYYEALIAMHNSLGIDADDAPRGGGGGYKTKPTTTAPKEEKGVGFFSESNEVWRDYRAAKVAGDVPPKHPDFKGPNGNADSVWETDLEGNPDPRFGPLSAAADGKTVAIA